MTLARVGLAAALAVALGGTANAQIAILQIQISEGEGAIHAPGARVARFLSVEVTDEIGAPVAGAAVTFHLPEDGPTGIFLNGLRTDVAMTDSHGRATLRALALNRVPGRFQMRIIASKEQARAGIISFQYIAEPVGAAAPVAASARRHRTRWIAVAALVAGGAVAGVLTGRSGSAPASATQPSPPAASAPSLSIGTPTVTLGKP